MEQQDFASSLLHVEWNETNKSLLPLLVQQSKQPVEKLVAAILSKQEDLLLSFSTFQLMDYLFFEAPKEHVVNSQLSQQFLNQILLPRFIKSSKLGPEWTPEQNQLFISNISNRILENTNSFLVHLISILETFFSQTSSKTDVIWNSKSVIQFSIQLLSLDIEKQVLSKDFLKQVSQLLIQNLLPELAMFHHFEEARKLENSSIISAADLQLLRKLVYKQLLPLLFQNLRAKKEYQAIKESLIQIWKLVQHVYTKCKPFDMRTAQIEKLDDFTQSYILLCNLFEQFFFIENDSCRLDLRLEPFFFQMLLFGLSDSLNSSIIKRSVYLLKRIIDVSQFLDDLPTNNPYFTFSKANAKIWTRLWELFFLIFDALDQHSVHLIQPLWNQIYQLFPKLSNDEKQGCQIDFEWIEKCLFLKAIHHSNFTIHKLALVSLFAIDFSIFDYNYFSTSFVLEHTFKAACDPKLYTNKHQVLVGPYYTQFYHNYLQVQQTLQEKQNIVNKVFLFLSENPIILTKINIVYLLQMLASYPNHSQEQLLTNDTLTVMQQVLQQSINLYSPWIQFRMHSLLLQCVANLSPANSLDLITLTSVISFMDKEVLLNEYVAEQWSHYLHRNYTSQVVMETGFELLKLIFSTQNHSMLKQFCKQFAYLIRYFEVDMCQPILESFFTQQVTRINHSYSQVALPCAQLVSTLLQINPLHKLCVEYVVSHANHLINYVEYHAWFPLQIEHLSNNDKHVDIIEECQIWSELLHVMNQTIQSKEWLNISQQIVDKAVQYVSWLQSNLSQLPSDIVLDINTRTCVALQWVQQLLPFVSVAPIQISTLLFAPILKEQVNSVNHLSTILPSHLMRQVYRNKWYSMDLILYHHVSQLQPTLLKQIANEAMDILETFSKEDAYLVFDVIRKCSHLIHDEEELSLSDLISTLMNAVLDIGRKYELECFENVTATIYDKCHVLEHASDQEFASQFVKPFFKKVLKHCEYGHRPFVSLVKHLCAFLLENLTTQKCPKLTLRFTSLFIECLTVVHEKVIIQEDDEMECLEEACQESWYVTSAIKKSIPIYPSILKLSRMTNAYLYTVLEHVIANQNTLSMQWCQALFTDLMKWNLSRVKLMCMPNSVEHKARLRVWKALVLLSQVVNCPQSEYESLLWQVMRIPNMTSVRKWMELTMIHLTLRHEWLVKSVQSQLELYNEKVQYLSSMVVIAVNVMVFANANQVVNCFTHLYPSFMQLLHTHQHILRSACQIVYIQLFNMLLNKASTQLQNKQVTEVLYSQLPVTTPLEQQWHTLYQFLTTNDGSNKWVDKYKDSFLQNPFTLTHVMCLLTIPPVQENSHNELEVIDEYIPRYLYELLASELHHQWYNYSLNYITDAKEQFRVQDYHKKWNQFVTHKTMVQCVPNYQLFAEQAKEWKSEWEPFSKVQQTLQPLLNVEQLNYQRKIELWKQMDLDNELSTEMSQLLQRKPKQSIQVIASLIDYVPNLAGLTRTSEIFQVEMLLFNDIKVMDEKDYKGISVSAEGHQPIEQLPIADIGKYCQEMKLKGYTIVGVEQTSQSVSLERFTFPKKTVLLLGAERTGIPAELIDICDVCVEIPQFGIIRSLNVHVSSSIMIFEYTRQQLQQK